MSCRAPSALAVLAVAALAACGPQPEPPTQPAAAPTVDLAAEEQAIRDASMQWQAAEQERDLLTVMSFMDANVTTIFDGRITRGRAALEARIEERWRSADEADLGWQTERVGVAASGDLAYERGAWTMNSGKPNEERGEFVTVWKKVDGEWKVIVDAGSTITG